MSEEDSKKPFIIEDQTNNQNSYNQGPPPQNMGYPQLNQPNPYNNYVGVQPNQPQNNMANNMPPPPQQQRVEIPPQYLNHPRIVIIQQHYSLPCVMCGYNAGSFMRTTAGCAAFSWCVCLFLFTGIFCCWVPFCIPTCMDHEIVCARCGYIKGVIEAQCC